PRSFLSGAHPPALRSSPTRRSSDLAVPNDALLDAGPGARRAGVLRVREGRVQRVEVRLGLRGLAMTEVLEGLEEGDRVLAAGALDRKSTRLNSSHVKISYAVFCLKK